jgi:hypothetical protein
MCTTSSDDRLLGIYLNDHLAGSTAGVELAKRVAGETRGQAPGEVMGRLAGQIAEDRDTLVDLMRTLDVPVRTYKNWLGWAAEKAGRLKPNGRVLFRSPSSLVVELEALLLGVEGKAALWRSLRTRAGSDSRVPVDRLEELLERARQQAVQVERLRLWAVAEAFGGEAQPLDAEANNG